jgi:hypothetical protein
MNEIGNAGSWSQALANAIVQVLYYCCLHNQKERLVGNDSIHRAHLPACLHGRTGFHPLAYEFDACAVQAEKLNGRAAMVGYFLAYFVDSWTGSGLYDQQNSFLGKLALHLVVFAILILRSSDSLSAIRTLLDEATFYDKQWGAQWQNQERPKEQD